MANDDRQLIPPSTARHDEERGSSVVLGALVVIALVGAYVALGTPGLHTQVARAPVAGEQTR